MDLRGRRFGSEFRECFQMERACPCKCDVFDFIKGVVKISIGLLFCFRIENQAFPPYRWLFQSGKLRQAYTVKTNLQDEMLNFVDSFFSLLQAFLDALDYVHPCIFCFRY